MKKKSILSQLRDWLNDLPIEDPIQRQMALLFQSVLIGLIVVVLLATLVLLFVPSISMEQKLNEVVSNLFGFLVVALPLGLLRRGFFRGSLLIIIIILLSTPTLAVMIVFGLLNSGGILFQFTLAIILAGLLMSRGALALTFGLSAAVVGLSAFRGLTVTPQLARANVEISTNFILMNGLIALLLDRFGITLRTALTDALTRERELQHEIAERKRVEHDLQEQHDFALQIIDTLGQGLTVTDENGHFVLVNPAYARLVGYEPRELIGRRPDEITILEDQNAFDQAQTARRQGRTTTYEARLRHKNGSNVPVLITGAPRLKGSRFHGAIASITDLTEIKRAEQTLRESEARLRDIIDNEPECVKILDFDGRLLEMNPAGLAMIEAESLQEITGRDVAELVVPEHRLEFRRMIHSVSEGNSETLIFEIEGLKKTHRWLETHAVPLRDHDRVVKALLGITLDITERKRTEEKLQLQNRRLKVLREIDTAILASDSVENIVGAALDHALELIECQRASMALFDWGTNEVLVFNVRAARETSVQKGTRAPLVLFQAIVQTLSKNQPALINDMTALPDPPPQYQALIKDGLRSMCALPLFSQSALIGSFSMYSEISGFFDEEKIALGREVANQVAIAITQSRMIETLQQLNTDLEIRAREHQQLISELTTKNAELERFTYTASHDLRSPLVTIKGFLGYLELDAASGNVERLKGDTKRIANAVDKMGQLLDDLLELSRIGRIINAPETIPFVELVQQAIELTQGRLRQRGVRIELQPDLATVYGDKARLTEVLQNLLDNAAKYMGDQPHPLIEIGTRGEEAGQSIFYVRDNGIGIEPEYREKIFGLFNKLDARSEGTGIGLALVKRIIEYHGGRIWVESEMGRGSIFLFTLPPDGR